MHERIRDDTLLVSVMHVNNETGARQPLREVADGLADYPDIFLHSDAAQGYGKLPIVSTLSSGTSFAQPSAATVLVTNYP